MRCCDHMNDSIACSSVLLLGGHWEAAQIVGNLRIFRRQRIDVTNLDINRLYAGPFGARTEEPAEASNNTLGVERIAENQKLHQFPDAQIMPDHPTLGRTNEEQH